MRLNFIILCLGFILSSCSVYWTEGSTPLPRGKQDQNEEVNVERIKEQKDLFNSLGLTSEGGMDESFDVLLGENYGDDQENEQLLDDDEVIGDVQIRGQEIDNRFSEDDLRYDPQTNEYVFSDDPRWLDAERVTPELEENDQAAGTGVEVGEIATAKGEDSAAVRKPKPRFTGPIDNKVICTSLNYIKEKFVFLPGYENAGFQSKFDAAHAYFCNNGAQKLEILKANSFNGESKKLDDIYVEKIIDQQTDKGSHVAFGTATREGYTSLDSYEYVNRSYCTSFDRYSNVYGKDRVKDVESIEVLSQLSNTDGTQVTNGCSYHLVSKPLILKLKFSAPEYNGTSFMSKFLGGRLVIEVNYLTESVNLLTDLLSVTVAYKNENGDTQSFSYRYSSAVKTGFHETLVKKLTEVSKKIVQNRLAALKTVTLNINTGVYKM